MNTIKITKTVTVEEKLNFKNIIVVDSGSRDINSIGLEVYYMDSETHRRENIGFGSYNRKTNFAHITLNEENEVNIDLEQYIVDSIENRTILIL